jgi:hypothetical protein
LRSGILGCVSGFSLTFQNNSAMVMSTAKDHLLGRAVLSAPYGRKNPNTVTRFFMEKMEQSEKGLAAGVMDAQRKAEALFAEIPAQNLIRRGAREIGEFYEELLTVG